MSDEETKLLLEAVELLAETIRELASDESISEGICYTVYTQLGQLDDKLTKIADLMYERGAQK